MSKRGLNEQEIFGTARRIDSCEQREAYLHEVCGDDVALKRRVGELLGAYTENDSFLDARPIGLDNPLTLDQPAIERPGTLIGPYKLLEQIGEGGFGVVFMSEQTEPVRRKVALKVLKAGMDTRQVVARFEAERQALAIMDHPNIARVFDGGATATGRPYFVMELVRGVPITEYCDQNHLSPRERLELFATVCHAVQHAHQKGLIHRDLKPSNVLVSRHDTTPIVKIIDFGVAKALGQSLTDKTLFTGIAQMIGTPMYMSPEQAGMSDLDVDTRSDIYSLGVLLYELLTGTTPFDKERLKSVGFDEMRRIIREDDPPKPSTRISTIRAAGDTTAPGRRGTDPRQLSRLLRGELDWIVMKALEKDRSRRYESASALAADIQRYLSDEPVLACPPTTMYRFQKFARRQKPVLATAAAITLCLLLGTTVSAWQAVRATTAEAQAKSNATEAQEKAKEATDQRDQAQRQRDEIQALNERLAAKDRQLQRALYAAHMNLAKTAWESDNIRRVIELLDQYRPQPGELDLRGFEWHYLNRLIHSDLLTIHGQTGTIPGDRSLAFSPDGKRLVSGVGQSFSNGKDIKIWDAESGRELLTLTGHTATVFSVAFSPDGKRLASASADESLKIWDVVTGKELLTCEGRIYGRYVAFSPDGQRVAGISAGDKGEVKVWNANTGKELFTCREHKGSACSVAFSPDGERIAGGSYDGSVRVWDAQSGRELLSLKGSSYSVAYSPDSQRLAGVDGRALKLWDARSGQELLSVPMSGAVNSVTFDPAGTRLATASSDGIVRLWDAKTGKELRSFKGHVWWVNCVAFNADGSRLASSSGDGTIRLWDVRREPLSFNVPDADDKSVEIAESPDGNYLAAGCASWNGRTHIGGAIKIWNLKSGEQLQSIEGLNDAVFAVGFSPDSTRLAVASGAWNADKKVYVSGDVRLIDVKTGNELVRCSGHTAAVASVAFSPDGKRVASSSSWPNGSNSAGDPGEPGEVIVWDATSGQQVLNLKGHKRFVDNVMFSPDGQRLATTSRDRTVKIWNAQTGEEIITLAKRNPFTDASLAFSPDGKRLATGSGSGRPPNSGEIKLWDVFTGQELLSLKGHATAVRSVSFSPDGKRLVSSSGRREDGAVKLWDTETGQEIVSFSNGARSVAFSPDGHRLIINTSDGVRLWDATPLPEKP